MRLRRIQVRYKKYAYSIRRDGVAVKMYGSETFGFMFTHSADFSYDSVVQDHQDIHRRVRAGILERLGVVEDSTPRGEGKRGLRKRPAGGNATGQPANAATDVAQREPRELNLIGDSKQ